jgi:cyclohexanecarboxylate-CoA ligase/acyl-CoA synthetase
MDVWEPAGALDRIAEYGCTMSMTATPFVQMTLDRLASVPELASKMSTMRRWICAGAPIPEVLLHRWSERVPDCALLPVYGRSEGLLVTACAVTDPVQKVLSSDGRAFPGVILEIRDGSARRCRPARRVRSTTVAPASRSAIGVTLNAPPPRSTPTGCPALAISADWTPTVT